MLLPANKDIVQTAQAMPNLSILVEAVVAAGLVDTLKGTGPYTVFAPTDAAFAALLAELGVTKDALLADTALFSQKWAVSSRFDRQSSPFGYSVASPAACHASLFGWPARTTAAASVCVPHVQ